MNRLKEALRKSGKYYSDKCFSEKFHIYRNGFEVNRDQYDRIQDNEIPNCKITINGKYAELKYNNIKFTICDGEYLTVADGLMKKAFKGNITIAFYNNNNKLISKTDKIKSSLYYIIKIECQFAFKDMKGKLEYYKMDYNATVSDATKKIPFLFEHGMVLPNEVTILDENKRPITDKKRTLNSIPDFEKAIFFSISDKSKYSKEKAVSISESTAKSCYRDTSEVYKYLVSEGLFYTEKCLYSNLRLSINGIEKKPNEFKDVKEIKKSQVSIRLSGKTVTIKYDGKQFIAQEGETVLTIVDLVKKVCKYIKNITVSKIENKKLIKMSTIPKLKSADKYVIQSDFRFRFKPPTGGDSSQMIDYASTVADGQNQLAIIYGCDPSCIVILDDNKDEITDLNRRLNTIPNYTKQIYFDIVNTQETTSPSPHKDDVPSIKLKSSSSDEPPLPSPKSKSKPTKNPKDEKPKAAPSKSPQDSFNNDEDKISPNGEKPRPTKSLRPKIKKPVIKYTTDDDTEKPSQPNKSSSSSPKKTSRNPESEGFSPSEDSGPEPIEINFIFDKSNEKPYYNFREKLRSDMTMKEIEEMIAEKYDIDDKITINSKEDGELTPIGSRTTIESNLDGICEKVNGKSKYYLYIKITKRANFGSIGKGKKASNSTKLAHSTKDALKKPLIRPKKKSDSDDDDDEDDKVECKKPKPKPKPKYTRNSDDDDEDDDDSSDEKKSRSNFSPSKGSASMSLIKGKKENVDKNTFNYGFVYGGKINLIALHNDSTLKDNESKIKEKLGIDDDEKIDFFVEDEEIERDETKMKSLQDDAISVLIHPKKKKKSKIESESAKSSDDESQMFTYTFQTNIDEDEHSVMLPANATVQSLKKKISEMYEVDNLSNIKIIFAGKDLLSNLVLKDLEIEDTVVFAYVRTLDDILLMTAKANVVNGESD